MKACQLRKNNAEHVHGLLKSYGPLVVNCSDLRKSQANDSKKTYLLLRTKFENIGKKSDLS
jgi:hypothetical protein